MAAIREAGLPIAHVPYAEWRRALIAAVAAGTDNPLRPFAGLFPERIASDADAEQEQMPRFDCSATEAAVAALAGDCPPADRTLFDRYLHFLQDAGALPEGASSGVDAG